MTSTNNRIILKMLDRLFASLTSGPSLNARPHSSRQRVDLSQVSRLGDLAPEEVLRNLLGPEQSAKLRAHYPQPPKLAEDQPRTAEQQEKQRQWTEQQNLLKKLRVIAEDAKTYEQDTGAHVLHV